MTRISIDEEEKNNNITTNTTTNMKINMISKYNNKDNNNNNNKLSIKAPNTNTNMFRTSISNNTSNKNLPNLYNKTKSEFKKRLMNENSITKYKILCIGFIKSEEEFKKICEIVNITNFDFFLEENLFSDKIFLYKLESLVTQDVNKNKKETFFKDEIRKLLEGKLIDFKFNNKLKQLDITVNNHINNIQNFNFFG
jgi:hypothetical protein